LSAHEVTFPTSVSYQSSFSPTFRTAITKLPSGVEQRVSRRDRPLIKFDAQITNKDMDDLAALRDFIIMRRGSAYSFRVKDWSDFSTSPDGRDANTFNGTDPTNLDVELDTGDGTSRVVQLVKRYTDGVANNVVRNITKPVQGSVLIAFDGVAKVEGVDFSVDYSTGQLTHSAPTTELVTGGFKFDVPARIDSQVEELLDLSINDFDDGAVATISMQEVPDELPSISDYNYGGASYMTTGTNAMISLANGRVQEIDATAASLIMQLPDPTDLGSGALYFIIIGASGTNAFDIVDHEANGVISGVIAGQWVRIVIGLNASGAKKWVAK